MAFHALSPTWTARRVRPERDIDFATRSADRKAVADLLAEAGYTPDRQYNALYGHKQLYFVDQVHQRPADVLVDRLDMCHRLEFAARLAIANPTLPLPDLLLSKLQIVKINRKDVLDALILLAEHPLATNDGGSNGSESAAINVDRIVALASADWGWWRTITGNLATLLQFVATDLGPGDLETGRPLRFDPKAQIATLSAAIDAGRKSARWRLRARVGDRVRWYEEPEEIGHGD